MKFTFLHLSIVLALWGCNHSNAPSSAETLPPASSGVDTTKKEPAPSVEKKLNVLFKTKLVEWGGDGKWHDMSKTDEGSYWVNYGDPIKVILDGNYTDLAVKIKSSTGAIVYNKTNIALAENTPFEITNGKLLGEYETNFTLEVKEKEKIIFSGKIVSVPGGE